MSIRSNYLRCRRKLPCSLEAMSFERCFRQQMKIPTIVVHNKKVATPPKILVIFRLSRGGLNSATESSFFE